MWKEWLFPFNPFNPVKALRFFGDFAKVKLWIEGESDNLPPPNFVYVLPTNSCNFDCLWCKNRDFRRKVNISLTVSVFLGLPNNLHSWGVKRIILSGGEPLIHPKIVDFLRACQNKISVGILTNGANLAKEDVRKAVTETCDWVSISLDSAMASTHIRVKKSPIGSFDKVIKSIEAISKERKGNRPRIIVKFLIHHLNYGEMKEAAGLSKNLGADCVVFKPFFSEKYTYTRGVRKVAEFNLIDSRNTYEDDNFKIYGIVSNFDREWKTMKKSPRCWLSAVSGVFSPDSQFYLCPESLGNDKLSLGYFTKFETITKKWGSQEHRELVNKTLSEGCPHCEQVLVNCAIDNFMGRDDFISEFIWTC